MLHYHAIARLRITRNDYNKIKQKINKTHTHTNRKIKLRTRTTTTSDVHSISCMNYFTIRYLLMLIQECNCLTKRNNKKKLKIIIVFNIWRILRDNLRSNWKEIVENMYICMYDNPYILVRILISPLSGSIKSLSKLNSICNAR